MSAARPNPGNSDAAAAQPSRIWIVAGGPSLAAFDLSILHSQYILCVNDAFRRLHWASGVVSIDSTWQSQRAVELRHFAGEKWICRRRGASGPTAPGSLLLPFVSEPRLSETWRQIHAAGTSGYAALNIAYLHRPHFIGLLGYDYRQPGNHWFDNYAWPSGAPRDTWQQWAEVYDTTKVQLAKTEVINFNPESAITAFRKAPLCDVKNFVN